MILRPRRADAGPIPLQIQILECDFIDSGRRAELADGYIEQGIQFDALGRPRKTTYLDGTSSWTEYTCW